MATQPNKITGGRFALATATVTTSTDGLSDVIDLGGHTIRSIQMSTAWTNAGLTFMGAATNSTADMASVRVTTACTELNYASTAGYVLSIDPDYFAGMRLVQLRSGTTATPVAQAAEREVILGLIPVDGSK